MMDGRIQGMLMRLAADANGYCHEMARKVGVPRARYFGWSPGAGVYQAEVKVQAVPYAWLSPATGWSKW